MRLAPVLLLFLTGCSASFGQVHQGNSPMTCPAATVNGTAYAPMNTNFSGVTPSATPNNYGYTDAPAAGSYGYIVQAYDGQQYSDPSNVAGPATTAASQHVFLNWLDTEPGLQYVVSRAPAIHLAAPTTPVMGSGTVAMIVKPALPSTSYMAKNDAPKLRVTVR